MTTKATFERRSNSIDDRLVRRFWDMDRFADPATVEPRPEPLPLAQVLANVDRLRAESGPVTKYRGFDLYWDYVLLAREAR